MVKADSPAIATRAAIKMGRIVANFFIVLANVKGVARRRLDVQSEANEGRYPPLPLPSCSHLPFVLCSGLAALEYTGGLAALEAEENVNHSDVTEHPLLIWRDGTNAMRIGTPLVLDGINLCHKCHALAATWA